jgi:heme exporter protein D
MNWNSASEFFAMGGYGLYVWGSFGVSALAMLVEPLLVQQRHKHILQRVRRQLLAEQHHKDNP